MNPQDARAGAVDALEIDALVAGDLAESTRRDLLIRLDASPDGWRRCALAFLEDQAWRDALGGPIAAAPAGPTPATPDLALHPRRRRRWLPIRAAAAASLAASTFAAGFAMGGASRVREVTPVAVVEPRAVPRPAVAEEPTIRNVGYIDLVDRSAGETPPERVPILEGPGPDERWLQAEPSPVPDYVRAQWERRGFQMEERRRFVPLALEDGRRVSIPVDEVALEYVGQKPL